MSLPVLMDPAAVAAYLDVTEDTLARWRASGEGPASVKIGQRIAYPESAVADYINAQLTGSKAATPAAIAAGMKASHAGVKEALLARRNEMIALDRESSGVEGVTPLTVGNVGQTPGIEQFVFQDGKWVPGSVLSQPVVEAPPPPHILNRR